MNTVFTKNGNAAKSALLAGLILGAAPVMAQFQDVTGTIVDQKGYKLRNVIIAAEGSYDTTDMVGKFGIGRGPVVGLRNNRGVRSAAAPGMTLAGSSLRFAGLSQGAVLKADLMLASGRRAGSSVSLNAAGGRADLDLNALSAGMPREGLYVLRVDAGNAVEHHLLARVGNGSWVLSSQGPAAANGGMALRKSGSVPTTVRVSKPGYETKMVDVPGDGNVGIVTLKLDASSSVLEAPFDVAPLYYPTGWAGDYAAISVADETTDIRSADPDQKCSKWTYQVDVANAFMGWAAVIYQYPENNWGLKPGRRVIGATKITFWAKGAVGGEAVDFKTGNDTYMSEPEPGMYKDTYGAATHASLTKEWAQYEIPLTESNTTMVISGFVWATTMGSDGAPVTFFIDEVRFE